MRPTADKAVVRIGTHYYRRRPSWDASWGFDRSGQAEVMLYDRAVAIAKEFGSRAEAIRLVDLRESEVTQIIKADL